jgi:hypothetical protein
VLLFVIFDRAPAGPLTTVTAVSATTQPYPDSNTQSLAVYLFKNQLVNLELAGLILTLGMIGAILIARRKVVVKDVRPVETLTLGPTPVDDNPHSIPVYGTQNPRAKAYPET